MAMLGALSGPGLLPLEEGHFLGALEGGFSGRHLEINRQAFAAGQESVSSPKV